MDESRLLIADVCNCPAWTGTNTDSKLISLELKEAPLGEALKQFSNVSGYKVNFPSEDVRAYRVSVSYISWHLWRHSRKYWKGNLLNMR